MHCFMWEEKKAEEKNSSTVIHFEIHKVYEEKPKPWSMQTISLTLLKLTRTRWKQKSSIQIDKWNSEFSKQKRNSIMG